MLVAKPYVVPLPIATARELLANRMIYVEAILYTAVEAVGGLLLGTSSATLLALFIYFVPGAEKYVMPYAIGIKSTPVIAVAPLLAVWWGPGLAAKIVMSALISFFPVLQALNDGLQSVPEGPSYYVSVLGVKRSRALRLVFMWFVMPSFASALKVAAPLAVVGAMVSEFLGSDVGVGHLLFIDVARIQTAEIFASIISVMLIGWSLYSLASLFDRLTLKHLKMERKAYGAEP